MNTSSVVLWLAEVPVGLQPDRSLDGLADPGVGGARGARETKSTLAGALVAVGGGGSGDDRPPHRCAADRHLALASCGVDHRPGGFFGKRRAGGGSAPGLAGEARADRRPSDPHCRADSTFGKFAAIDGSVGISSEEGCHDRSELRRRFAGDLAARSRRDGGPARAQRLACVEDRSTVHGGPSPESSRSAAPLPRRSAAGKPFVSSRRRKSPHPA